jgi:hypothetical protein
MTPSCAPTGVGTGSTPAAYLRRTVVNLCLTWRARAALARSGCGA